MNLSTYRISQPSLLGLCDEGGADEGAVGVVAVQDGGRLAVRRHELAGLHQHVEIAGEAAAVPLLVGVGLEDRPVLRGVLWIAVGPGLLGVVVVVQHPGVGADVELGRRVEVVAGEDHVGLLHLDRTLEGGGHLVARRVDVVHLDVFELVAPEAAVLVDLVNGHHHAVAHLDAIRGDEAADGGDAHHVDVPLRFLGGGCGRRRGRGRGRSRRGGGRDRGRLSLRLAGRHQAGAYDGASAHFGGRAEKIAPAELLLGHLLASLGNEWVRAVSDSWAGLPELTPAGV